MLFARLAAMRTRLLVLSGYRIRSAIASLKSRHLQLTMGTSRGFPKATTVGRVLSAIEYEEKIDHCRQCEGGKEPGSRATLINRRIIWRVGDAP